MKTELPARVAPAGRGFTLVELLVVVSIVVMLVALLLPSLGRAKETTRRTACASNMRQFALACLQYDSDYGQMPTADWGECFLIRDGASYPLERVYGAKIGITICPSAAPYPDPSWAEWGIWSTYDKLTYHYFAGNGLNNQADSPGYSLYGWYTDVPNLWWIYESLGLTPQLSAKRVKNFKMPFMADLAEAYPGMNYWYKPQQSNHMAPSRNRADGENLVFYDTHVVWQNLTPGVSWHLGRDYYDRIWWTPSMAAPAGAVLMP